VIGPSVKAIDAVELFGGPADGQVGVANELRDGVILLLEAPAKTADGRPTFAMYRLEFSRCSRPECNVNHWRFIHIGTTDENIPFVDCKVICGECLAKHNAVMPWASQFPIQCPECSQMACWPSQDPA